MEMIVILARITACGFPAALQLPAQGLTNTTCNEWESAAKFNFSQRYSEMLVTGLWGLIYFYIKYRGYCRRWLVKSLRNKREISVKSPVCQGVQFW